MPLIIILNGICMDNILSTGRVRMHCHKEINVAEFARSMGMNATLLRNYINGFKKPSAERESAILGHIHKLGKELMAACF